MSDPDFPHEFFISAKEQSDRRAALGFQGAPPYGHGQYAASVPDRDSDGITLGGWIARLLLAGIAVAIVAGFVAVVVSGVIAFVTLKALFSGARRRRRR